MQHFVPWTYSTTSPSQSYCYTWVCQSWGLLFTAVESDWNIFFLSLSTDKTSGSSSSLVPQKKWKYYPWSPFKVFFFHGWFGLNDIQLNLVPGSPKPDHLALQAASINHKRCWKVFQLFINSYNNSETSLSHFCEAEATVQKRNIPLMSKDLICPWAAASVRVLGCSLALTKWKWHHFEAL